MTNTVVRVRFAPSPTGFMHLGNVRAALINYLFAYKKNGIFILRIEDTDQNRNFDPNAQQIIADLKWLHLTYQEGPIVGGPHEPYYQSQRNGIYQTKLQLLQEKNAIYRCFCTEEELDGKRQRQIALKKPPRYDRTCLKLTSDEINSKLTQNIPFIWRVKLDQAKIYEIHDMGHGIIKFDMSNFSDFPITRADGSYTFIFANFVDDMVMQITHVMRGEDHMTNTASQAALYDIFGVQLPTFWHLPIICNSEGKKLSKRDFGFSLNDLREAGYLPEAICNYLGIIGTSFDQEIMSLSQMSTSYNFDSVSSTGFIRYDVEKLNWVNKKWIASYDPTQLTALCLPYLTAAYPQVATIDTATVTRLIQAVKTELTTLKDIALVLSFYFEAPLLTIEDFAQTIAREHVLSLRTMVQNEMGLLAEPDKFMETLKNHCTTHKINHKDLYAWLRLALMGNIKGPSIKELIEIVGVKEAARRIAQTATF
jgi:nondiscriminating glutamyl-tRNA synthetase